LINPPSGIPFSFRFRFLHPLLYSALFRCFLSPLQRRRFRSAPLFPLTSFFFPSLGASRRSESSHPSLTLNRRETLSVFTASFLSFLGRLSVRAVVVKHLPYRFLVYHGNEWILFLSPSPPSHFFFSSLERLPPPPVRSSRSLEEKLNPPWAVRSEFLFPEWPVRIPGCTAPLFFSPLWRSSPLPVGTFDESSSTGYFSSFSSVPSSPFLSSSSLQVFPFLSPWGLTLLLHPLSCIFAVLFAWVRSSPVLPLFPFVYPPFLRTLCI